MHRFTPQKKSETDFFPAGLYLAGRFPPPDCRPPDFWLLGLLPTGRFLSMKSVNSRRLCFVTLCNCTLVFIIGTIHCSRHFLSYGSFWLTQFDSNPEQVKRYDCTSVWLYWVIIGLLVESYYRTVKIFSSLRDQYIVNLHFEWVFSYEKSVLKSINSKRLCFVTLYNHNLVFIIGTINCSRHFELNFSYQFLRTFIHLKIFRIV